MDEIRMKMIIITHRCLLTNVDQGLCYAEKDWNSRQHALMGARFSPTSAGLQLGREVSPARRAAGRPLYGMFFSTTDVGNLLFAKSDQRFFNPVWFPYFARPTHVEEVPPPTGTQTWNPFARLGSSTGASAPGMWMFEKIS